MSVVGAEVPARRRPVFDEDFDVMSGYRLSYSGEFPKVRFGATVWDFSSVPDIPKGLTRSYLVIDWNRVDSRWRVLVKELLAAMLCPLHPAVVALPQRRQWPLPFISLRMIVSQVRHWLQWLDGEGVGSLDAVTQQSCDGYLLQFEHQSPGYRMNRVIAVRWLHHYAPVLSEGYRDGFMPWGRRSSSEVAGFTTGANKTPPIPDQALHAMLTGALFLLGRPAEDVIAATAEARALPRSTSAPFSVERFNDGVANLAREHVERAVPLPRSPYPGADRLSQINLGLLARRAGVKPVSLDAIKLGTRKALLDAVDRVGIAEGGLLTTPSTVDTPTGPRAWTDPLDGRNHRHLLTVIAGACTTVIAGLSGLRESELHELGIACVQRIDLGDGQVRWRLRGKVIKYRPHGGEPESWTVIEEVVHAARIQARLLTAGADRLFASAMPNAAPTSHSNLNRLVRTFIDWQNQQGRELGLPAVPEPDGRRVSVRQFRRTLARQLAYQPHGTIAGKIHLKHIRASVTEGYFGAPGESASAFLEDVEREMQEARVENYERRFRAWQDGEPLGGAGALGMTHEFEALAASFNGVVDLSDRRTRQLIRKRAGLLHIGPINDCHFTDPRQARCLARRGVENADGPIIAACQPSKCANAVVAREHLPRWQAPVLQIDNLLEDRKVPKNERARLHQIQREYQTIIDSVEGSADGAA
ncbi:MAG: hypothetical protein WCD11_29455 [Solirubrobacteraceae bacterium]